jgi:shikimate kinase
MVIVLLGYMGSGKSTVGRVLAQELGVVFTDLDEYIEAKLGRTISELFREKGEVFFRKKEHELLKEWFLTHKSGVLALGGGTPCYAGNMDFILGQTNNVCYLRLTVPSLVDRLRKEQEHRPLITHLTAEALPEFIGNHLFERAVFYSKAHITIPCDQKSVEEVVTEIQGLI